MPGIENLNFQVILDYRQFNKDVAEVKRIAKGLNFEVSQALDFKKKISAADAKLLVNAEKIRQAEEKTAQQAAKTQTEKAKTAVQEQRLATEAERTRRAAEGTSGAVARTNAQLTNTTSIMRVLSQLTGTAFSVIGIRRFLSSLIDITGQFEVQRMALRNMLQDIDAADKIFQDLYRFSSDSTYRFSELAKYAKQLAAFNIPKEDLLETTKMLGDVASGVGVSMDRIILAYGHVKSSGFLRGIQLRSFAQNGVPVLEELAKQFSEIEKRTVGLGEIFDKMMRREIPFEMVEEAFRRMTSEGGKFYRMQEVLAKTLAGQINILKGRWENLLAAMGQANEGILKGTVQALSNMVSSTENFGKAIKSAAIGIGAYEAAMILAAVTTGNMAIATTGLTGAVSRLFGALVKNPWAIVAAGVALAAVEIYKFRTQVDGLTKIHQAAQKAVNDFNSATKTEIAELDALYAKLKYAEKGTKEYDTAKLALQSRFGPYIDELRAEGVEVENLTTLYDGLETKIKSAAAQRYREAATHDITTAYGEATGKIERVFNHLVKNMENGMGRALTAMEKEGLWQRMTGGINDSNISQWAALQPGLRKGMEASAGISTITDANILSYMREAYGIAGLEANITTVHAAFDALRVAWKKLSDQYVEDTNNATAAFNAFITQQEEGAPDAAKITTVKIGDIVTAIKNLDTQITALREKAKKEGLLVNLEENIDEEQQLKNLVTERKQLADQYEEIMGIKYDRQTKNDEKDQERADREAIQALKQQIGLLETYLSIYRKMEAQMGADGAATWMSKMFGGDASKYKTLETQITNLTEKLREYGEAGKMAAYQEEARLGLGKAAEAEKRAKAEAKATADAEKALNKYLDALDKWVKKNQELSGTGAAYNVSKAIGAYKTALKDADDRFYAAAANLEKGTTSRAERMAGYARLDQEWAKQRANALVTLRATLAKYVDDIFKEELKKKGVGDLSDWNDKNLSQILAIKEAISEIELPKPIADLLENLPEILKEVEDGLQEAKDDASAEVDPEVLKKVAKYSQKAAQYIGKAADAMRTLATATGNLDLAKIADVVDDINNVVSGIASGMQAGGMAGAWIGGAIALTETFITRSAEAVEAARQFRDSLQEIAYQSSLQKITDSLKEDIDTIFGDNFVQKMRNAANAIDDANEKSAEAMDKAKEYWSWLKRQKVDDIFFQSAVTNGPAAFSGNFADLYARIDSTGKNWRSLASIARDLNTDLFDENGFLNPDFIDAFKKQYGDLNSEILAFLNAAALASKENAEGVKLWQEAVSDLFDSLASDMTDKFIDNFKEMGNAVEDLGDVFENLGETILKSLMQSFIIDKILKKYQDEANRALDEYTRGGMSWYDYASWLDTFTDNVQREVNALGPALNNMIAAFADRGLLGLPEDETDSSSVGKGIKSITEETASILASYLNAIRADVSYMRSMAESGWLNVENIARAITPNLADYVQQIAANTYNTAETTAAILSELQSVIGAPGATSPAVIRVEMA